MSRFAIRYPYLIVVICLITCVVGVTSLVRMPVDLFPPIKIPVVVVATFYSGMPPEQVENDITGRFERFFTLGAGIDHIESRSLPGVSLIKVYFQPGVNADSAVTSIANLAMADLRRLPPGTLPPVLLKFDASSLPVCLITLKGQGLSEAKLRDLGQFDVRNQVANVPGASVPMPFGGRYRQIMVYVDPLKLEAHQLSVMDVVRSVNNANLILPAGDVKIGGLDYNLYANSQINDVKDINLLPLKTVGDASVLVGDVGKAQDASQIQYNVVRVDGQPSVYLPVLKQGGDANTIAVVDGIKNAVAHLLDVPRQLITRVVFDQSVFVRNAIENLIHEGLIGLVLTGVMILIFLGSMRATVAVFLSIPLSALAAFIALAMGNSTVNAMILGGLALAFSRLIDNSVVVLENIFRHMEMGEPPEIAAERGGREVALPVLAATLTTAIVFFPVIFLYGVSKFLFTALALAVILSLFASYLVAMTVVPLFCAKLIKIHHEHDGAPETGASLSRGTRFNRWFNRRFQQMLDRYEGYLKLALVRPVATVLGITGIFILSLGLYPFVGEAYFPRTDPGQFVINLKAPTGTRIETTDQLVEKVEQIVREVVPAGDLKIIVSNIGVTPGFSSIYTPNAGPHTAFVQVGLKAGHHLSSFQYMDLVRARLKKELPQMTAYFQTGGLVDAILNMGLPAPLDIQVSGMDLKAMHQTTVAIARQARTLPGVSDVLVPQDVDYPALQLNIDRLRASELGLNEKEVVGNVITALTSDMMIAPSYWVDPKTGNDYFLTVQYPENYVKSLQDLSAIPLRGADHLQTTRLDTVSQVSHIESPTEVDHYQLRRVIDVYVSPAGEDLGRVLGGVEKIIHDTKLPSNLTVTVRGAAQAMQVSFRSFGLGLILATLLVYLILVAQFKSFLHPLLILLAVPTGLAGVLLILFLTGTTLNVMSLMGVVMVVGMVVANSILLVEFTNRQREHGLAVREALVTACRSQLRPILVTSLATVVGLLPMAAKFGAGSEAYAPLARAIIGGLAVSVVLTVFIVPAAYLLAHRREKSAASSPWEPPQHST
ncbi:MAG TPA: efflux RND transporter permease subunit [Candidatus Acidoferrales bacterium]|nr:efflux RND transporter permease subunit [Candidatus Acidoferrales bacterium]